MRNKTRGDSSMFVLQRAKRPQTGLVNNRALALILEHPTMISANFEALSMLDWEMKSWKLSKNIMMR